VELRVHGNAGGVVDRLTKAAEGAAYFVLCFETMLRRHKVLVVQRLDGFAQGDGAQDTVKVEVISARHLDVGGGHQRDAGVLGEVVNATAVRAPLACEDQLGVKVGPPLKALEKRDVVGQNDNVVGRQ